jgi:hypothetical protein
MAARIFALDVGGSQRASRYNSYSENRNKMQQYIKMLLFLILNEAQHVSGDTTTAHPTTFHSIMQNQRLLVQF